MFKLLFLIIGFKTLWALRRRVLIFNLMVIGKKAFPFIGKRLLFGIMRLLKVNWIGDWEEGILIGKAILRRRIRINRVINL